MLAGTRSEVAFQSTPARGGRLGTQGGAGRVARVSIHARTRRATAESAQDETVSSFQSTPARGGRRCRPKSRRDSTCRFNPRPHAAGDCQDGGVVGYYQRFNPRPHAAGDPGGPLGWFRLSRFQSTPARGGRRRSRPRTRLSRRFNPRPHAAGDDLACGYDAPGVRVSIHARTRRATGYAPRAGRVGCFNPRPHAAGDTCSTRPIASITSFNPRPHAAGDDWLTPVERPS